MAQPAAFEVLIGAPSPAQGVNVIPAYSPSATTATVLTNQPGNAALLAVGTPQYLSGATTAPSYVTNWDGRPFGLRVSGKVTTKASCNVTIAITVAAATATTYTSGNVVATTGAVAVNTASANFDLHCELMWDNVSQKLAGIQTGQINNSLVTLAAITNAVSVTTQAGLQFVLAATFSDTTTGTTLTISEFEAYSL